jgi:hypothetical protein
VLDDEVWAKACSDPKSFRASGEERKASGAIDLDLQPFASVRIDADG